MTPFLHYHKFLSFRLLNGSLVDVFIAESVDIRYNYFVLLSKQPSYSKLNYWNSKGDPLSVSRSSSTRVSIDVLIHNCSIGILGCNLGEDVPRH